MDTIKTGYAPTRRSIFSAPDARKYRGIVADRLRELNVEFVDIDDINDEGLLFDEDDRIRVLEKFRAAGVDGLFLPHCNFGTEFICARLARDLNVPVLLWGPLDERPKEDGTARARAVGHEPVAVLLGRQDGVACAPCPRQCTETFEKSHMRAHPVYLALRTVHNEFKHTIFEKGVT
jgi:hypothetical protein